MDLLRRQLTPMEYLTFEACCLRKNRAKRVCISSQCKQSNIYQCGKQQNTCTCHFQHKNCPSISLESLTKKITHHKSYLKEELRQYVERFQKVYLNLERKIKKQLALFNSHYESMVYGQSFFSIQNKISNKKIFALSSFEIGRFLNCLQPENQAFNSGKLSMNEAKQLDKKTIQIFQLIQNLYKQKLTKTKTSSKNHAPSRMRSFSSCSLQQSTSTDLSQTYQMRNSSAQGKIFDMQSQRLMLMNKNISAMLEKKSTSSIGDINLSSQFLLRPPKISLEYPRIIQSKIVDNCSFINSVIGKKIKNYEMAYRASQNNFQISKFYQKTDYLATKRQKLQKETKQWGNLILIKNQFNCVLGAYTQIPLTKKPIKSTRIEEEQQSDEQSQLTLNPQLNLNKQEKSFSTDIKSSTFLFSNNLKEKYDLSDPTKALYLGNQSIGFGKTDLRIRNHCHIRKQSYWKIGDTFKYKSQHSKQDIDYQLKNLKSTGSKYGKKFKILEWEYFIVHF